MSRYNKFKIIKTKSEDRESLIDRRGSSQIEHFESIKLHNPDFSERAKILTKTYVWKLGDRLYLLADKYYGDSRFWWVIAWYNSVPTEANLRPGAVIEIPLNLEQALNVLKA
jgi:nucleoid-associated protein YgaU